jgi:hypothetical protein
MSDDGTMRTLRFVGYQKPFEFCDIPVPRDQAKW